LIPKEIVDEIRGRVDMVSLVGEHVRLVKRGTNHVGLCPFHNEKTPSFNVSAGHKYFHCFGCQQSGDPFEFLMQLEGISFPEAARQLGARTGVEIPDEQPGEGAAQRRAREHRQRLISANEAACRFFEQQLVAHPQRQLARAELEHRGVDPAIADRFRLGYAPHRWDELTRHLQEAGVSPRDAEEVGLIARNREGTGHYDRFRGRLMFPVRDVSGSVLAFSGRILPQPGADGDRDGPKYINSPESPIYRKGSLLFGLHEGRVEIRRRGSVVLCEGNFDLLALHQAGFPNAVAPLGTAFTTVQARLLSRYAEDVVLLFDGDAAGTKAIRVAHPLLAEQGLRARVAALPKGEDPDSYLRARGAAGLEALIGGARGSVEYLIDSAAAAAGETAAEQAAALESLGSVLADVKNSVELQLYIERVGQRFGVSDPRVVRQQLRKGVQRERSTPPENIGKSALDPAPERVKLPRLQAELLGLLLDRPALLETGDGAALERLLTSHELREVYRAARAALQESGVLDVSELLSTLEESGALSWLKERLALQVYRDRDDAEQMLHNGIPLLAKRNLERELPRLSREITEARRTGDDDRAARLTRDRDQLRRSANDLLRRQR